MKLVALALVLSSAVARADDGDGFHATPSLYWQNGEHRLDLTLAVRSRLESWDAFAKDTDSFIGTRTRLKLAYDWHDQLVLVGEVQDVRVASLDSNGTGALANYRNAADGAYNAHGTDVHLLWAEFRPTPLTFFRVGRQDLKVGPEVTYPEADWRYLKTQRLGERLIGSVGFSHEERAADGITLGWDLGGHQLLAFAAQPTTGVFEVENAYRSLHDVTYEGAEWTVKRGTWLANTELTGFAIAYQDTRPPSDAGLAHGISLVTFGGSGLGVYPVGPGKVDVLLYGAGQLGSYNTLDQAAWAVFLEAGYQLPECFLAPWLRVGVNVGSGDPDEPHLLRLRGPGRAPEPGRPVRAAPAHAAPDARAESVRALVPPDPRLGLALRGQRRLQQGLVRVHSAALTRLHARRPRVRRGGDLHPAPRPDARGRLVVVQRRGAVRSEPKLADPLRVRVGRVQVLSDG
jgi:hypothetical protein